MFVRTRPLNSAEKAARSYSVVDTPNPREITVKVGNFTLGIAQHQVSTVQYHTKKDIMLPGRRNGNGGEVEKPR